MKLLDRYEEIVGHQEVEHLRRLAGRLTGKRIVHVNSTRTRVAEWLDANGRTGNQCRLGSCNRAARFLSRHKGFSQWFAGFARFSEKSDFDLHYEVNRENAQRLNLEADVVFVHDPQPIYLRAFYAAGQVSRWILRCHRHTLASQLRKPYGNI